MENEIHLLKQEIKVLQGINETQKSKILALQSELGIDGDEETVGRVVIKINVWAVAGVCVLAGLIIYGVLNG